MNSNTVRKSIARVLTVTNQKQRQNLREFYKSKKYLPLDLRKKQTRAIRRRLNKVRLSALRNTNSSIKHCILCFGIWTARNLEEDSSPAEEGYPLSYSQVCCEGVAEEVSGVRLFHFVYLVGQIACYGGRGDCLDIILYVAWYA